MYQNYKPIEDEKLEVFAKHLLEEAKKTYGSPAFPVKEVFFFQSKIVKKPYLISIADVRNWQALITIIKQGKAKYISAALIKKTPFSSHFTTTNF